ncbi:branched-chain amino acid ABC transporter permease [Geobacter argillaceus]|uniref:Branched-chain amino acid transport system permease protein n=1 Tax=Geobacter argillaceus TaxID=345631 RepID=A0A562VIR0_9BACT|nr:branched-chain amino acid ABC transporter permease [Geobacter argillaceus]TWJ17789.1 branched-chain amino acid transport system permease protein [Geobacter argillaceus]
MSDTLARDSRHLSFLRARERWKPAEIAFWLALVGVYFVFPTSLIFASQILITGLFALSLDMILGYAGIVTLGHAAFFGIGAYTAGLMAAHGWHEPLSGLLVAGLAAGIAGYLSSFLLSRGGGDLTRLMITLGIGLLLFEVANSATEYTGGVDGLQGVEVGKLFGVFGFDLYGKTAYAYVLGIAFLLFAFTRSMMHSPYGLALRSMRENQTRALAIGIPISACLTNIYTIAAVIAGIAGALLTQTTQFVGIDVLSFQRSADLLIILIIGGTATLYGGFVGAAVFMLAQDRLSNLNPQYWLFWLGIILIVMTLYLRGGMLGGLSRLADLYRHWRNKERP